MDLYSQLVKFALLYALPLLFISVTYYQIVRVLWRSARMVVLNHPPSNNRSNSAGASVPSGDDPTTTAGSGNASRNHDNNSTSGLFLSFPHQSWQDSLFFLLMDGKKIVGYMFLCYVIASIVRGFLQPPSSFSLEDGTPCCSWQSESIRFQAGNQVNLSRQQQRALTFPFRVLMCAIKNTYFLNENLRHSLFILWKIDGVSGSLTFLFLYQLFYFFYFLFLFVLKIAFSSLAILRSFPVHLNSVENITTRT